MRVGSAQRELSSSNGERFLAPGYGCVPRAEWLSRYGATVLPTGAHLLVQGRRRFVVAWEDQHEHAYGCGV